MNSVAFEGQYVKPSKIVCVGRNYAAHIAELGNNTARQMVVFCKPNSAITDRIILENQPIDYEGEICFICRDGTFKGIGFGLDLTKRDLQDDLRAQGLPWERSKAFDGSALFSKFNAIERMPKEVHITLKINGTTAQDASSELMLFNPDRILEDISEFMTLEDNDIVMTGTPAGVGQLKSGDILQGSISCASQLMASETWKVE